MPKDIWNQFGDDKLSHGVAYYLMMIKPLLFGQGYTRLAVISKRFNITTRDSCCNGLKPLRKWSLVVEEQNKFPQFSGAGECLVNMVDGVPVRALHKEMRSLFTICTHDSGNCPTCDSVCYLKDEQVVTE
jgi:hypothetical protein